MQTANATNPLYVPPAPAVNTVGFHIYQANVPNSNLVVAPSILGGSGTPSNDAIQGTADIDFLYGGEGSDYVGGGSGGDVLRAGPDYGADTLGSLNVLEGGPGADYLYANTGLDLFVFGSGSGQDQIFDFDGIADRIVIQTNINGSGVQSFADLQGRISERSGDAFIDLGAGNSILVDDVPAVALGPTNFLFVEVTAAGLSFV